MTLRIKPYKDLTGQIFNELTILSFYGYVENKRGQRDAYWHVLCSCGKKSIQKQGDIIREWIRSCHQLKNGGRKSYITDKERKEGSAGLNGLYGAYIRTASLRGYDFCLSLEEFSFLTKQNCHYCGSVPAYIKNAAFKTKYTYNGIDRKNNLIGYVIDNCVPCCGICNLGKRNLSYEQFMNYINNLIKYRNSL